MATDIATTADRRVTAGGDYCTGRSEAPHNKTLSSSVASELTNPVRAGDSYPTDSTSIRRRRDLRSHITGNGSGYDGGGGSGGGRDSGSGGAAGARASASATTVAHSIGEECSTVVAPLRLGRRASGGGGVAEEGVGAGLRSAAKKALALARDPSRSRSTLEALEVDEARLRLWVRTRPDRCRVVF